MEAPLLCFGLYKDLFLIFCVIGSFATLGVINTKVGTFRFRAAQVQIMFGIIPEFGSLNWVLLDTKLMHARAGGP